VQACGARADEFAPGLAAALSQDLAAIEKNWPSEQALPAGVIHADLFQDNIFFLGERCSGVIDFYFACNDFLAYDLAICLNAWCFEVGGEFNITKATALLAGYQQVRKLLAIEIAALPTLAAGAALRFALTRLFDWLHPVPRAMVQPKDPGEYLRKLRFHRDVSSAAAYGVKND
jgi:homoserine kinase type II